MRIRRKSKARDFCDHLCVLRSHHHRETGNTVQHYTSRLDAVAEFGVQCEDQ